MAKDGFETGPALAVEAIQNHVLIAMRTSAGIACCHTGCNLVGLDLDIKRLAGVAIERQGKILKCKCIAFPIRKMGL